MARGSDVFHRPLRHERGSPALLRRDLLDPFLEDEVTVGGLEGAGVGHVDFVLATTGFPFGELHRDVGGAHLLADRARRMYSSRDVWKSW